MRKYLALFITIIVAVVLSVIICIILFSKDDNTESKDNKPPFVVNLEIGMTLNQIEEAPGTNVVIHESPVYECKKYYINSFDYYMIDDYTAITIEDNRVKRFYTWDENYYTIYNLSVNSTLGDVLDAYSGYIECWYESISYNFISMSYEATFYLFDSDTCTSYVFLASQLTTQQVSAMLRTGSVSSDGSGRVYLRSLSSSIFESISSITVAWIMKSDCGSCDSNVAPDNSIFPPKELKGPERADLYIKFLDSEKFTLSDDTVVNASLTTMGLGDLTLNISWSGKTPTKLVWEFDGFGMAPTSGEVYSVKNGDNYSLREWVSFDWTDRDPDINGVKFTIYPITEEQRKYEL